MGLRATQLLWPTITGVLAALFIVQQFPELLGERPSRLELVDLNEQRFEAQAIPSFAAAVDRAAPSVVSVFTRTNRVADDTITPTSGVLNNLGSGVIVTSDGYVITNNHVVAAADRILIALKDGREQDARIIGTDPESDLALLKINLTDLPNLNLISSSSLKVGDVVLAIGNPFGVGQTVTQGIISGLDRNQLGLNTYEDFIQTDAAINPGNSGGALITARGDLVGINTAIFSKSGGSQGIGFAIPADQVTQVMQDLISKGRVVRGWVGVEAHGLTPTEAQEVGLDAKQTGLMISGIFRDSPAQRAGIRPGDVLLEINDTPVVGNGLEAMNYIAKVEPGEITYFTIYRNGEKQRLEILTSERPTSR
ncbi:MAG: trypsin-like peptidase domain-containing protein [Oceanospirillaceae bacterium]|nr:trypsin-like peptidase domain-containing protein [Oceanospirillaceae bacterium]